MSRVHGEKSSWLERRAFPAKEEIREKLGLKTHAKVIYKIEYGGLIVEPVLNIEEILKEQPS